MRCLVISCVLMFCLSLCGCERFLPGERNPDDESSDRLADHPAHAEIEDLDGELLMLGSEEKAAESEELIVRLKPRQGVMGPLVGY